MVEKVTFAVVDEGVTVVVKLDAVDLFRHRGIVYLDADDADEVAAPIDGHVI